MHATMQLRFESSKRIADHRHGFTEVSGLDLSLDGGFWAVSDGTARIFHLDEKGRLRNKSSLDAEPGLEGVAFDAADGRILAVREDTSEILEISQDGRLIRHSVLAMEGASGLAPYFLANDANDGLEGITVDPDSGRVFVVKERTPRLLIEIAPDLAHVLRVMPLTAAAGFTSGQAEDDRLDVSGLAWDARRVGVWITSDTGQAIYFFNLTTMQAKGWSLVDESKGKSRRVSNSEGVALSDDGHTVFIITDDGKESRLIEYRID